MARFNLIIFHTPGRQHVSDFTTIRTILGRTAPDIEVHILSQGVPVPSEFWRKTAQQPTVLFSPLPVPLDPRVRGLRLIAAKVGKFEEARLMAESGFPVPYTRKILPDTVLDERQWGPFTVVKPNTGFRGRGIRLQRTSDVRWVDTGTLPPGDPWHGKNLIAQQFIDTGPHAVCYRVMTVLARPVYCLTSTALEPVRPLKLLADGPLAVEIAANGVPRRLQLAHDDEVVGLAKAIHGKLADRPVMGLDIIRDHASGRLAVLEFNSGGRTWHLSSEHGRHQQRDHGVDFYAQFNALDVIAGALAEVTHRRAV